MKRIGVAAFILAALFAIGLPAVAMDTDGMSGKSTKSDKPDPDEPLPIPTEDAVLEPPPTEEEVIPASMQVTIQQLYFPAKPGSTKSGTCRLLIRTTNIGNHMAGTSLSIRTYNYRHEDLDVWQVPTGQVASGETSERAYVCKRAHFIRIESSVRGWPTRCVINGVPQIPCGMSLSIDSNLTLENQTLNWNPNR